MEKAKDGKLDKLQTATDMNRRSFVKWSSVLVGSAAVASLVACKPSGSGEAEGPMADPNRVVDFEVLEGGEWRCGSCWLPCGGSCVNKAYVKDGVVLQQKTDTFGDDDLDTIQQRGCARGRSLRQLVYGADRIKYPIKRKNWQPGGVDVHGELRGEDEWERISWDEALEMAASEIKRISDNYGGKAIYMTGRAASRSINAYKGCSMKWGGRSYGGTYTPGLKMCGFESWPYHSPLLPDRFEYLQSKLIVLWGHNPAWSSQCNAIRNFQAAKEAGARFIVVDPVYHDSAKVLDAEFIPVRPAEDVPLLLALAYEMITNNLQDQAFLDTYTVGFDAEHLPEGADPKGSFKDYVLGTYDGQPKTPEWATEFCGTPVEMIRKLAKDISGEKPMAFTTSRAAARVSNGEEFAQAFLTVGWMTGNVGKPGACVGHVVTSNVGSGNSGPRLVAPGKADIPGIKNPVSSYSGTNLDPFDDSDWYNVCTSDQWKTVLEKTTRLGVRGVVPLDIRMIAHMNQADNFNAGPDVLKGIEAHKSVEFVLSCDLTMGTRSLYADIVLPAASPWECAFTPLMGKFSKECIIANQQITPPIFEARPDVIIEQGIAEKLGIDPLKIVPFSDEEQVIQTFATTTVLAADGKTKEPLFTITAEDIPAGSAVEPQQGKITIKQFYEDGLYKVKRSPDDNYGFTPFKAYVADPVANALATESGKLEIYCKALAKHVTAFGYSVKGPIAQYGHFEEGWMDTYADWDNKKKGDYPLMGLSLHGYRTVHSTFDNILQLREAFPNNLRVNPVDAKERGISSGDTVLVSSRWGKSLRIAELTERVMPGVLMMDQVMLANVDPKTNIDDAGCFNVLTGSLNSGVGIQAYNSVNLQLEKWTGDPIVADSLRPQRIVEV
jgi:anaerobic dimethyl sulfoxide reductase subunit A